MHDVQVLLFMIPAFFIMGCALGQKFEAWGWRHNAEVIQRHESAGKLYKVMDATEVHPVLLIEDLTKQNQALQDQLRAIGDFAHDHSAGPAVHDDLWWVREHAYELI